MAALTGEQQPALPAPLQGWTSALYPGGDLQACAAQGMVPLLDAIVAHVPPPTCDADAPFSMCVAMIDRDPYLGRIATGERWARRRCPADRLALQRTIGGCGGGSRVLPLRVQAQGVAAVL
jgi:GTP-binding protein